MGDLLTTDKYELRRHPLSNNLHSDFEKLTSTQIVGCREPILQIVDERIIQIFQSTLHNYISYTKQ